MFLSSFLFHIHFDALYFSVSFFKTQRNVTCWASNSVREASDCYSGDSMAAVFRFIHHVSNAPVSIIFELNNIYMTFSKNCNPEDGGSSSSNWYLPMNTHGITINKTKSTNARNPNFNTENLKDINIIRTRVHCSTDKHRAVFLPVPRRRFMAETGGWTGVGRGICFRFPSILFLAGIIISVTKKQTKSLFVRIINKSMLQLLVPDVIHSPKIIKIKYNFTI